MKTRVELEKLTMAEALEPVISNIKNCHPELTQAQVKKLVINSLIYNVVIHEIEHQVDWMLGIDDDDREED